MMDVICSWSGGKDSCFACYQAMRQGHSVRFLLNFISRESQRSCFHGVEAQLLRSQAEAIGIAVVQKEVSADLKNYEQEFKVAVTELKSKGLKTMVFGDIYLLDQLNWVERVCKDLGVTPIEPLWDIPPSEIMQDFIKSGFQAIVVSCQAKLFGKDFIGRYVDKDLVAELKKRNICPCGENGEFHTLVIDGPIFKKKIGITKGEAILKEGFWKHWFLDIQQYKLIPKERQIQ